MAHCSRPARPAAAATGGGNELVWATGWGTAPIIFRTCSGCRGAARLTSAPGAIRDRPWKLDALTTTREPAPRWDRRTRRRERHTWGRRALRPHPASPTRSDVGLTKPRRGAFWPGAAAGTLPPDVPVLPSFSSGGLRSPSAALTGLVGIPPGTLPEEAPPEPGVTPFRRLSERAEAPRDPRRGGPRPGARADPRCPPALAGGLHPARPGASRERRARPARLGRTAARLAGERLPGCRQVLRGLDPDETGPGRAEPRRRSLDRMRVIACGTSISDSTPRRLGQREQIGAPTRRRIGVANDIPRNRASALLDAGADRATRYRATFSEAGHPQRQRRNTRWTRKQRRPGPPRPSSDTTGSARALGAR